MSSAADQSKVLLREANRISKYNLIAISYQKLVVTGTAQALTIPINAKYMEIGVESSVTASVPIRYLLLGNTYLPTVTDGKFLNHLTVFDVSGRPNLENFRVIQTTAGVHTLHVEYYM